MYMHTHTDIYIHTHTHTHIYIYIFVCFCVCSTCVLQWLDDNLTQARGVPLPPPNAWLPRVSPNLDHPTAAPMGAWENIIGKQTVIHKYRKDRS